jgi:hypothetical protein
LGIFEFIFLYSTVNRWLDGKRLDDRAEGLWRIHNTLYDFDLFLTVHPGGANWLKLTKVAVFKF